MITLIKKDFKRFLNSPWGNLGMMSIPLIIALTLGAAFGGENAGTPRVQLVIENHDDSWLASIYSGAFSREEVNEMFESRVVASGAREIIENNEASAAVVIPENFGVDVLNGRQTQITVIRNPAQSISPEIAETAIEIMNSVLSQLRMVFNEPLSHILNTAENEGDADDASIAAISIMIAGQVRSVSHFVLPPAIKLNVVKPEIEQEDEEPVNIYLFFFPGLIILGVFFVSEAYMSDLLAEQRDGTLQRLLSAGVRPLYLLSAKVIGCIIYCIFSILLMRIFGFFLFGITWGHLPGEFLTLFCTAFAMTGIMCLVFGISANERQGSVFSTIVILTMSLMGGSMFPRHMMPDNLKATGIFTPNYWSLEAWDALLISGTGVTSIILPLTILFSIGAFTVIVGSSLLSRKLSTPGGRP